MTRALIWAAIDTKNITASVSDSPFSRTKVANDDDVCALRAWCKGGEWVVIPIAACECSVCAMRSVPGAHGTSQRRPPAVCARGCGRGPTTCAQPEPRRDGEKRPSVLETFASQTLRTRPTRPAGNEKDRLEPRST